MSLSLFIRLTFHRASWKHNHGTRGEDKGITSIRIRYSSPPPRQDDKTLQNLTRDRGLGGFRPRHTPLDVCAAQDVALGKARILGLAIRSTQTPRRDSGVNDQEMDENKTKNLDHISDSEPEDEDYAVKSPPPLPPAATRLSAPSNKSPLSSRARSPKRPFSEISSPSTAPEEETPRRPPLPPPRATKTTTPQPSTLAVPNSRTKRGRKTPVRPSELRNLGVDAAGLDPNRHEPVVRKLYLSKGKWYEFTGPGRPEWAEDEKEEVVPTVPPSTKRARASISRYAY
ncbi:hypothetical protein Slin15195_G077290 [Septoria linicola]|uniref:Uncharacterized protein n=1 Tax=Septoria linicola TaxID=215465 RepID=A0A9Q9ASP6_9PEZI|nr:hypothetical protein Slin14017_G038460 [Septoria linicola]USW54410.1 hypothetical protein Slin15195_G077290 [Septoria linicola]